MTAIRVLIVDDQPLRQCGLCHHVSRVPDFTVVACTANPDEAIALSGSLWVSVILLSLDMPGLSGFEAARRIRSIKPDVGIVF